MPRGTSASPAEKAQKQLDQAIAGLERAEAAHEKAHNAAVAASENLERAEAWVVYAKKNPDLPTSASEDDEQFGTIDVDQQELEFADA